MKTLYVSDLDGTLIDDKACLSENSAELLNQAIANGCIFSVATARTQATAGEILGKLNLNLPIIVNNGCGLFDLKKDRYVFVHNIKPNIANKVIEISHGYNIYPFVYITEESKICVYYKQITNQYQENFKYHRNKMYYKKFTQTDNLDFYINQNGGAMYITMMDYYNNLLPVYEEVIKLKGVNCCFYEDVYNKGIYYLECFSGECSKANAVRELAKLAGADRIVSFGDNLNDIPMFEISDVAVAVENSHEQTKAKADVVIGSNLDDSVAKYIYNEIIGKDEKQ